MGLCLDSLELSERSSPCGKFHSTRSLVYKVFCLIIVPDNHALLVLEIVLILLLFFVGSLKAFKDHLFKVLNLPVQNTQLKTYDDICHNCRSEFNNLDNIYMAIFCYADRLFILLF